MKTISLEKSGFLGKMKIKLLLLSIITILSTSCMKREFVLVCNEEFLNNKIYMETENYEEIKLKITNSDSILILGEDGNLKQQTGKEYIELRGKFNKQHTEIILYNPEIKLPVLFFNEQSCTILSEQGVLIEFNELVK